MSSLPAGTVLGKGRYRVLHELNRGGTAVVYEGLDLTTHTTVALKVMSAKDGRAAVPAKGVRREIEYAASVQHDNIVKLVDFVADDQQVVIVWELIEGSDLLDLLNERGGRLEEPLAAFYFAQLLQGVTFIHANGLCHRDLKPENCMVERSSNRLKIIDFGLSKHQQSAVTLGVGTPDYMAPELLGAGGLQALQERRTGQYDARACDVWAMGVLLYLLVTGQYPFEDPAQPHNVVATLQNIAAGRMRPLPRRLGAQCVHLISAMLTRDPQQRITLQGISEHPWLRAAAPGSTDPAPMDTDGPALGAALELSPTRQPPPPPPPQQQQQHPKQQQRGPPLTPPPAPRPSGPAAEAPRLDSFSFPASKPLPSKPTPVTPKVIVLQASASAAAAAAAGSPTVSAPLPVATPARGGGAAGADKIVPVSPWRAPGADAAKRSRVGVGGFCKLWMGGFGGNVKATDSYQ